MRLARYERQPEGTGLQVGEPPSPAWEVAVSHEQSFAEFYARMHGPLLDHAERFVDKEEARDAESEAMMVMWRNWPALSLDKRSDKYAFGVLTKIVRARAKANRKLVSLDHVGPELDRHAIAEAPSFYGTREDMRVEVLEAALAAMPARRREVLLLRYEQGFRYREVAEALGLAEQTINTHLHLGYEDLRAAFTRAGFQIPDAKSRRLLPRTTPKNKGGNTND
jgi:RNA polymerase sigma factor (sigma-70 family)